MKYGFIGCGNMGGALARALAKATKDILLADYDQSKAQTLAAELGVKWGSNEEAAACDRVFVAVKPQMAHSVLESLIPIFQQGHHYSLHYRCKDEYILNLMQHFVCSRLASHRNCLFSLLASKLYSYRQHQP